MQWWSLKEAWFKQAQTGVDFVLLPRLACVPQHGHASARSWTARTAQGHVALLSVYLPGTHLHCDRIDLTDWTWLSTECFGLHLSVDD
ncbi:hypothetical protein SDC9_135019 [bioreactor metagenome]|uniref:Uncharacterized protein n=1 Tax=bioreactor metagenome TaxID=1076179 RepID=A0A645DFV7_9ZZZZ